MAEILILSAGRRVALVRAFMSAAYKHHLLVVAGDVSPEMSSACYAADKKVTLPHVLAEGYADALLEYCAANKVKLVVPTIDTELATLANLKAALEKIGVEAIVSDCDLIRVCRDKRLTAEFFSAAGVQSPKIYRMNEIEFPALVKPYDGSLSSGISVARSEEDLTPNLLGNPKNIFCRYLDPLEYEEFTCDSYFDRNGTIRCVVPRLRLQVRGGEIAKGQTVRNQIVPYLFDKLEQLKGARGCLTIQIMKHRATDEMYLIEVNPRFGGGYPLTAQSGAAFHDWLIKEYVLNETVPIFQDWADRMLMLRYDDAVFIPQ